MGGLARDGYVVTGISQRDAQVAEMYKRYLHVVLDNKARLAVVTWGLTARDS